MLAFMRVAVPQPSVLRPPASVLESSPGVSPHLARDLNNKRKLCPLHRLGDGIAAGAAGKAALRTNPESLRRSIGACFIEPAAQVVSRFDCVDLAADQSEKRLLVLRQVAQG